MERDRSPNKKSLSRRLNASFDGDEGNILPKLSPKVNEWVEEYSATLPRNRIQNGTISSFV